MEQEGTSFQRSDQGDITTVSSWRKDSGMQRSHQTLITDKVCNQKESRDFASAANAGHKKQFIHCNPDCNQV